MSLIHEVSPKHCANKKAINFPKLNGKFFYYLSTFFLAILSLVFLVWLILHPTKPQFSLQNAEINVFNLLGPYLLNSSIVVTLQSNNPNKKVGIYYDQLLLYASYGGQKITTETLIPPFYEEHEEKNLLSASLVGNLQPVDPSFAYKFFNDQRTGSFVVNFKVMGRLRWKVGTWVSGSYRFLVNCATSMPFGPTGSPPFTLKQGTQCSTSI
ncbi:hypothetical protein RD792_000426 [Penstemon davidsonii]|uniref:Late embryogenesis abundant protein LEA-2 subgroup domain-containing protein n=1 Tax=Penstemon davidsonii TaxID=160366 RepID=A0ABR0DKU5_9LAMI|nr:hypothetical protein RD792_000426 [Penstemon davidsonii]